MTADPILDIVSIRYSVDRTFKQPGFWLGLAKARDVGDPRIAAYGHVATVLGNAPEAERDLSAIPEAVEWLNRRRTML